jgi:hypothetical protein
MIQKEEEPGRLQECQGKLLTVELQEMKPELQVLVLQGQQRSN